MLKAGTDAHLYDDPHDADIVRLLDSKFDAEKVEALKRLLALMSQGFDVSTFFPQVVKSVASQSLEVKKLVYIYLVHYAEKRPDEALLSINTFQKDLVDFNPLVRAWALRAMCGIRVHVVAPLMMMAVQKCAKDPSPYVRRCAANAIPKLYALNKEQYSDALEELIGTLLDDKSAGVLGAAAAAFTVVCPERFGLVAQRFRELCDLLPDVEEWGQVLLVDILLRYVVGRHGYPAESEEKEGTTGFLRSAKTEDYVPDARKNEVREDKVPDNTELLLQCTSPLLWSHNSAVVLAAAGVHWLLAPKAKLKKIVKPLLFLMRSSYDTQYVVMANLLTFVQAKSYLFEDFYEDFFVRSSDTHQIRAMKLDVLALIATESSITAILQELQAYVRDPDRQFAASAVSVIGKCVGRHPSTALTCMEGLLTLARGSCNSSASEEDVLRSKTSGTIKVARLKKLKDSQSCNDSDEDRETAVVTQAVLAIRSVASQHFKDVEKVFARLVRDLDLIRVTAARAVVVWMIGEYSGNSSLIKDMLPAIFSYLAACFVNEEVESKLQILNCIPKIVVRSWEVLGTSLKSALLALAYILDLGSCDINYDVRDRARMLKQLMGLHIKAISCDNLEISELLNKVSLAKVTSTDLAATILHYLEGSEESSRNTLMTLPGHVLTSTKLMSLNVSMSPDRTFLPGSMSHIVHHNAPGYKPLPEPCSLEDPGQPLIDTTGILEHFSSTVLGSRQGGPEELGEGSDYSESYSSSSSNTGSDDDDSGLLTTRRIRLDNGIPHSGASESGSVSSNGTPKHDASLQGDSGSRIHHDAGVGPLICLSDNEFEFNSETSALKSEQVDAQQSIRSGLSLRSSEDLESWLGSSSMENIKQLSQELRMPTGVVTLSLDSIKREPRKMTLLDFTNGEGLEVMYSYCFAVPENHYNMVWVKLYIANRSSDVLSAIYVKDWELEAAGTGFETSRDDVLIKSGGLVIPSHEIDTLNPQQVKESDLYVDFHQHLVPVKLAVYCDTKCYPVKLVPDIGAFLRPKVLTSEEFAAAESRLIGMFETTRRCSIEKPLRCQSRGVVESDEDMLSLARLIALRVLSHVNAFLVTATIPVFPGATIDDAWSVHLKFSGETLTESMLCLVTLTLDAHSSTDCSNDLLVLVKVNCEDSVFGLNLLKRLQMAVNEK